MCAAHEAHPTLQASFADRAKNVTHPLSNYLLRLMELKKSNLCLSADVPTARELLSVADNIGPSIVVLKTHYDMVAGWDFHPQTGTGAKLQALGRKHGFLIFEDRKFGDIGSTVQKQYTAGTARVIDWAHIVNINMVPGKAGVTALAEAAKRWRSRVNYEVKTSVSVGTPVSNAYDENEAEEEADHLAPMEPPLSSYYEPNGRKGSIVSITTLTQSFEPVDSPRFPTHTSDSDDYVCAGIEEPPWERGLLILAQMSSQGNFMNEDYTRACQEAAREHKDFVMGFIAQGTLNTEAEDNFISMTPGCQLPPEGEDEDGVVEGDGLGQQYNTPSKLVGVCGSDIIIVGRGILKAASPRVEAEKYRRLAWNEYLNRIGQRQQQQTMMPCTNCRSRKKESACRYETGTPLSKSDRKGSSNDSSPLDMADAPPVKAADFGYSHNSVSTLGILRKIEGTGEPLAGMPTDATGDDSYGMRERYKALIRQLPPQTYVEKLADIYFHDINWQYFGIDEPTLRQLMGQWYNLPFNILSSSGPQALDPMLRAFPALLFQMLASALLYLPKESEEIFESLKYTSNMTFDDLAFDYSESGVSILSLLGKRQMSVITVLAGWVRAAFLKYTGMVTEAWHQVGTCIRDAQEIGLHRDQMDPQPAPDDTTEEALEKMWMGQARRTIWMILLGWDLHTGAVLGRPISVDYRLMNRSTPIDAIIPRNPKRVPLVPRSEDDPPTPLTRSLWAWEIMRPLREVLDLEKEGPFPKDWSRVEKIHQDILETQSRTPPPFRLENPDTRFDHLPECWWLPYVRPNLPQLTAFNLMALHRPYVFTRESSRHEALKASLDMLEAQRHYFAVLKPAQHRTFALFFGTFDAIVMIASIYILFPKEHPELLSKTRQHFQWAVERFEKIAERNRLAHAALGVLHAIWIRFKKAVGHGFLDGSTGASAVNCGGDCGRPGGVHVNGRTSTAAVEPAETPNVGAHDANNPSISSTSGSSTTIPTTTATEQGNTPLSPGSGSATATATGLTPLSSSADHQGSGSNMFATGPEWSLPTDFDFSSIMPMYPMGDVAYNDLTGILANGGGANIATAPTPPTGMGSGGGESSNGSVGGGGGSGSNLNNSSGWPDVSASEGTGMPGLHVMPIGQEDVPWQFGGEFASESIWNILNQIPPY
ncbi:Orotidine 5'-phosphate decarboxylase [Biscogniauxia mediterranea]|nr:Orotidine 5'-phosphate decarboxylase [Biscogniauxia mediterranea]